MKTSSAKAKGRKLQNHVRDTIMAAFPTLQEGDVESRSMGAGGVDILLSPAARCRMPLSIECKATVGTPSLAEMGQAKDNKYERTLHCVVWKPRGAGPDRSLVMFEWQDLVRLFRAIEASGAKIDLEAVSGDVPAGRPPVARE